MECGLSSIPTTQNRDRPTDLRQSHHTRMVEVRQLEIDSLENTLNIGEFGKRH